MAFSWSTPANALPTGDYQNNITTAQTFTPWDVASGRSVTAGEVLDAAEGTGLYMFPILHKYYKHLNYLLFDYNKPGQRSLKSKFLPIEGTMTTDGKSITWYDYSMFDIETAILVDAASSVTIAATSTTGYEVGDTILVVRKKGSALPNEKRVIASIVADTSVTFTVAVVVEEGDKLVRAFYVQEAQTEITRWASTWNYTEYKSFFQTFARTLAFEKSQLNRTYFFEKSAKEYVSSMFAHNMNILLQEFNKALYLGWNVPGAKSELLGIDTAIEKIAVTDPSVKLDFNTGIVGKIAEGSITIDTAIAADTFLVTINDDAGTAVVFDTDIDTTATAVALDITNNIAGYTATASGAVISIVATATWAASNHVIEVTATGTGAVSIVDLNGWVTAAVATDEIRVQRFMDAIEQVSSSGATNAGETITVVANRKFISQLGRLKKEDIVYNDKIVEINYEVIKFNNMFGSVEVIWDPMLDTISQKTLAYMLPKSLITLKFRQNQVVTDERGSMDAAKWEIAVARKIDNIPDVSEFYMYFEAALVLWGLSSGAYLKMENL